MWKNVFSKFNSTVRPFHTTPLRWERSNKLIQPGKHSQDLMMKDIRSAPSIPALLETSAQHLRIMNNGHLAATFNGLANLARDQPPDFMSLSQSLDFKALCNRAYRKIQHFTPVELLGILKTLSLLKVPSKTALSMAVLTALKEHLNDLDLRQLIFLHMLTQKINPSTPLLQALQLAIPVLVENHIEAQLDQEDISMVAQCFGMATSCNLRKDTVRWLSSILQPKISSLNLNQALVCFKGASLFSYRLPEVHSLLDPLSSVILKHHQTLNKSQQMIVFGSCKRLNYFPDRLFEVLYHQVLAIFDPHVVAVMLLTLIRSGNLPRNYMDDLTCQALAHIDAIREIPTLIGILAEAYAEVEHPVPQQLLEVFSELNTHLREAQQNELLCELQPPPLFKLATHFHTLRSLVVLKCYDTSLLKFAFDETTVNHILSASPSDKKDRILLDLLLLHWLVLPGEHQLSKGQLSSILEAGHSSPAADLGPYLTQGLGGSEFSLPATWSTEGHSIDYLIAMTKEGFPIPLPTTSERSSSFEEVEDLPIPDEAKKIAVLVSTEADYLRYSYQLRSTVRIKMATLEKLGYAPLLIHAPTFNELLDHEKVPYLMKELKDKVDSRFSSSSSDIQI